MKKNGLVLLVLIAALSLVSTAWSAAPQWTWRMQVIHSTAHSDFAQNAQTAEDIMKATGGRLQIKVSPNGALTPSRESFHAPRRRCIRNVSAGLCRNGSGRRTRGNRRS